MSQDLPLSSVCKRVLLFAAEEADQLSSKKICTEHLLLGLLRDENDDYALDTEVCQAYILPMDRVVALTLLEREAAEIERISKLLVDKVGPKVSDLKPQRELFRQCIRLGQTAKGIKEIVASLRGNEP